MVGDPAILLRTTFPCRAGPGARAVRHEVVIGADWSVRTGHDAALERIAASLGGGASCLAALDATMPALRLWWGRVTRADAPVIRSADQGSTWASAEGVLPCCSAGGAAGDPVAAAEHARSAGHVARATGADPRHLRSLVAGLGPAAAPDPVVPPGVDAGLVASAWAVGLAPEWVADVIGRLPLPVAGAVPVLLALGQTGADPQWVAATGGPAPDVARLAWLAWTATDLDRQDAGARSRWLATGSRLVDVVELSRAGYAPEEATAVAAAWGISVPGAAQLLARWVRLGYRPSARDLADLLTAGRGYPPEPPAPAAVARVSRMLRRRRATATELAVALVRWGTVPDAVAALRQQALSVPGATVPGPGDGASRGDLWAGKGRVSGGA